jgi:hypothetical protein
VPPTEVTQSAGASPKAVFILTSSTEPFPPVAANQPMDRLG